MKQKQKDQKDKFTNEQRAEILQKKFNCKHPLGRDKKANITEIIDDVIDTVKNNYGRKKYIREYWFTKQIEEWKKKNNKEPSDNELMNIVKEDLKVRIANTMLELTKHTDIKEKDIWFYNDNNYVSLRRNDDDICKVSVFNDFHNHTSPPYKPFFMKNKNDDNKLNGVCIYKHGDAENRDDKSKTKWIMACFKNDDTEPQCKITFQTNEYDKITNVEIKTEECRNSESIYTISLNEAGKVKNITKKGEEQNASKDYRGKIKKLLYGDKINKVFIERIEDELNSQQKEIFENIKQYIGVVKEENKEEENKEKEEKQYDNTEIISKDIKKEEEKKDDSTKIISKDIKKEEEENKDNSIWNCCGLDLSCLKSCKGIFY